MLTTLAEEYKSRDNGLNALRLLLALAVIVSHAPLILGIRDPYSWADLEVGGWAVVGFFAISGWLITGSRLNLDFAPFLWRRCLRIFPAFWVVLIMTAALFAPVAWVASNHAIQPEASASYALKNSLLWVFQPTIDGTLAQASAQNWNLSLWTLSWEMLCYLAIGVVLSVSLVRRKPWVLALTFGLLSLANLAARSTDALPLTPAMEAGLRLGTFFIAGAVLRMYAKRIKLSGRLAFGSATLVALLYPLDLVGSLGALPLAYLFLYLGIRTPFKKVGQRNDISYGVYVYAFPVGQLIVLLGGGALSVFWFTLLNVLLVIPFAWVSWLAIEQPALRLKGLVPSRTASKLRIEKIRSLPFEAESQGP